MADSGEGSDEHAEMEVDLSSRDDNSEGDEVLSRSDIAYVRVCGRQVCVRTLCKGEYPSLIHIPHH